MILEKMLKILMMTVFKNLKRRMELSEILHTEFFVSNLPPESDLSIQVKSSADLSCFFTCFFFFSKSPRKVCDFVVRRSQILVRRFWNNFPKNIFKNYMICFQKELEQFLQICNFWLILGKFLKKFKFLVIKP